MRNYKKQFKTGKFKLAALPVNRLNHASDEQPVAFRDLPMEILLHTRGLPLEAERAANGIIFNSLIFTRFAQVKLVW